MSVGLPDFVEPFRLSERQAKMGGQMPLARLKRLHPMLASDKGDLSVQIEFGVDEQRVRYLQMSVEGQVELVCERCLDIMPFELKVESLLGLVESEHLVERLPESYEPLVMDKGTPVSLASIIEDELILAIPLVPRHEQTDCNAQALSAEDDMMTEKDPEDGETDKRNPFAILGNFKETSDN